MDATVACLLGPTASGKSALALRIAERLQGAVEIVSVDSGQVYRGMDIGTAKPSAAERAAVPHHLIDLVEPVERYSAGRFRDDALQAIAGIHARGRRALLVGGTMLYYRALVQGLDDLPAAEPAIRLRIEQDAARLGWAALHARLAHADPVTAARLSPNDAQRIQRALEVLEVTGRPLSAQHTAPRAALPFALKAWALFPRERATLHARIAARFDAMLAAGLVEELRELRQRHPLEAGHASMRCVGYRQAWEFLEGRIDRPALRETGIAATRQLAKRQITWLRGLPGIGMLDPDAPDLAGELIRTCGW